MAAEVFTLKELLEIERQANCIELEFAGSERDLLDVALVADLRWRDGEQLEALRVDVSVCDS